MPESKKKIAGLSYGEWGLVGGGGVVLYLGYRWYKNKTTASTTSTTATGTVLEGGTTVPGGGASPTSTQSTTTHNRISSLSTWIEKVTSSIATPTNGYNYSTALNDVDSMISGGCVSSKGFTAIGNAIKTYGLAPTSGLPSLSVCKTGQHVTTTKSTTTKTSTTTSTNSTAKSAGSTSSGTPANPGLTASLAKKMAGNGEHVVATAWDSVTSTWLYLTQKGGVYTETAKGKSGGSFFGSYLGLPKATQNKTRTFLSLSILKTGGYEAISKTGASYNFKPISHGTKTGK